MERSEVYQQELRLWEAAKARDPEAFLRLVSPEAIMVCGGYRCTGREYADIIAAFDCKRYEIKQFEIVNQDSETVQVHDLLSEMSRKQAVAIATAAGGGMKSTTRDMADSLEMWGVGRVYRLGLAVQAGNPGGIPARIRQTIHQKTDRLAARIRTHAGERTCNPRGKRWFFLMRLAHRLMEPMEPEYRYWEARGWHKGGRPWKD